MNRRCITVLLGLGLGFAGQAFSQTISPTVKSASTITAADQSAIKQFVQAQVAKLSDNDPVKQAEGRDALANAPTGEPAASPAFNDAYAAAVNEGVASLTSNPSVRVRLNAAIAAARVADRTQSVRLKPVIVNFTTDAADPVALWGVKAHGDLIPAQLRMQAKGDDPLIAGLAPALKNRTAAPIFQEAYNALGLDIVRDRKNVTPDMVKAVIPAMQDVLAIRLAQYKNGLPENPVVDTLATTFLVDGDVWQQQTEQQKTRTVQQIADLLTYAAARTADYDKDRDVKDSLVQTLRYLSSAIRVISGKIGKPDIEAAALPVGKVDVSMPPATIQKTCDDLIVQLMANVPGVKKPALPGAAPTTR